MSNYVSEQWKPVVGFEGLYEVSDHGNVKSLARTVMQRNGTRKYRVPEKLLTVRTGSAGYPQVVLSREGGKRQIPNHVLVLEAFVGPRPEGHHACHWDDIKTNNHVSNLRWGTLSDNAKDSIRNGTNRWAGKTECKYGHELTPENTYLQGHWRTCQKCRDERNERLKAERRQRRG